MKVRNLLLAVAMVAFVAACAKKEAVVETPTATEIEEVVAVEEVPVEEPKAEAPKTTTTTKATTPAAKQETTKAKQEVDPCEKIVADFEAYAYKLSNAYAQKGNGAKGFKDYVDLKNQSDAKQNAVKQCLNNPTYEKRVKDALFNVKKCLN
ncbi:MAG: hypothetical protein LBM25_01970 [Bacteroidales bacterium]|jgi:hypothetical protein|nr:hypothetical protein [Bacteroidales bacterium]